MRNRYTSDEWRRIEQIFHEVADLPADQRDRALEKLPQRDQVLRSEVLSLLNHDADGGASSLVPSRRAAVAQSRDQRKPGEIVGRYRLLFPIAVSESSRLWCAELVGEEDNAQAFRVAIKFLGKRAGSSRQVDRFENEAQTLARLRHPSVAEFVDCGRDEHECPFIVTRFVAGESITDFADHNQRSIDERLRLMVKVCDAVEYAHRFLVVHRDLKPSNIVVTKNDEPVILDFGIAKELPVESSQSDVAREKGQWLTATHERPMTPAYASPEQVRGESITTSTDVHALGLILYELLSGHHPYSDAAHGKSGSLFDRVCQQSAKTPSEVALLPARRLGESSDARETTPHTIAGLRGVSPHQLRRKLSGSLDNVVGKALQKNPGHRYHSIAELRGDVENVLAGRPVSARPHREWFRDSVRNAPMTASAGTAMVAALLGGLFCWAWWAPQMRQLTGKYEVAKAQIATLRENYNTLDRSVQRVLKRGTSSSERIEIDDSMTVAARTALARQAVESGKMVEALALVGSAQFEKVDTEDTSARSLEARLNAAATWVRLGRPSQALKLCDGLTARMAATTADSCDAICIVLEAYQLAGWIHQAADWDKATAGIACPPNHTRRRLLSAESRLSDGWLDGAEELLTLLRADDIEAPMRTYDTARMDLVRAMLDVAKLARETGGDTVAGNSATSELSERNANRFQDVVQSCSGFPRLHAEALLLQCENAFQQDRPDEALESMLAALQLLEEHGLGDHVLALRVKRHISNAYKLLGNTDQQREWLSRCWDQIEALEEYSTRISGQIACDRLQIEERNAEAVRIVSAMEATTELMYHDDYLWSAFSWHAFRAAKKSKDSERLVRYAEALEVVEPTLWGPNSWDAAAAHAALSYARRQDESPHAAESHRRAVEIVRELAPDEPPAPAASFLGPFFVEPKALEKHPFDWLSLYLAHKDNNSRDQLDMVCYELENAAWDDRVDGVRLLDAVVGCLTAQEVSDDNVEFFVRVGKVAANRGSWSEAKPLIGRLLKEDDESIVRMASACLVYGQAVSGESDSALRFAREELARSAAMNDEHVPLRSTIWQLSEMPQLSQAERDAWKTLLH